MRRQSHRDRRPGPAGARAAIQLTCAGIALAVLASTWFGGLLAGPTEPREVNVVRLEPLAGLKPSAVLEAGRETARKHGLLVLRKSAAQPMPAGLSRCRADAPGSRQLRRAGIASATGLSCELPVAQRSWGQRLAGLVTSSLLVLAAAALLLGGLGILRLSLPATYALGFAVVSAVAVRAADPSAELAWPWLAVVVLGGVAAVRAVARARQDRHLESFAAPPPATPREGQPPEPVAPVADAGRQSSERERISLPAPSRAFDEAPERPDGLTPPTIGLPSRTARKGALVAVDHPAYPDTTLDWGQVGDLQLRAASARGASHRVSGRPRQDAFAVGAAASRRFAVAAVADGVGSSDGSQMGAAAAVRHGVAVLDQKLTASPALADLDAREVMTEVAAEMNASVASEVSGNGRVPGELIATTLVLVAAELHPAGARAAWCARTGDSDARLLTEDGWRWIFAPEERSAIASPATATLPLSPDAAEAKLIGWSDGEALVILSDGLAKPLGSGKGAVGRFLGGAWTQPPDPLDFAIQVQFRRRTFDDDRTAVVLWPHGPARGGRR